MAGRKCGSNVLASIIGGALIALAIGIASGWSPNFQDRSTLKVVNGGSSVLFGIVLLWWAASEDRAWGIGFETVTMVVGVVTAVIAILTLTHSA